MTSTLNLDSDQAKVSYGIGRQMGDQLKANPFEGIDLDLVCAGLQAAFAGEPMPVTRSEMEAAFGTIQAQMKAAAEAKAKEAQAAGERYLEENARKPGVKVTASGLQYEVIREGNGASPAGDAQVRTHYHGTFIDGRVFDSSVERNEPAEFAVNGVIAGWSEALQMMQVGAKWRLTVPAGLAYGAQGAGGAIPPHSTLVFEVELLDIL